MATGKKVTVYVNRRFTLNRKDEAAVQFEIGANVVDADVAEHPFVKAHTVGKPTQAADNSAELQAANDAVKVLTKRAEVAEAKVVELQAMIDAAAAMGTGKK